MTSYRIGFNNIKSESISELHVMRSITHVHVHCIYIHNIICPYTHIQMYCNSCICTVALIKKFPLRFSTTLEVRLK